MPADLAVWLDAIYAIWVTAPFDRLEEMAKQMTRHVARIDPEEARKTWGRRPEHVALAGNLGRGPGAEAGPRAAVDRWRQERHARSLRNPRGT